jgi:tRNA-Thr(GGU) m(6)t(6)A37 methyltransferase TsaA
MANDMKIEYQPIGVIHSPFKTVKGMPIQPSGATGIRGTVEIFLQFKEGLKDLDGFSHIILIYHFDRSDGYKLLVTPFLDNTEHGVFATRAPKRPNPVGLSVVHLISIDECTLTIEGVDVLDGTPLLDIKPYVPDFDNPVVTSTGWIEKAQKSARSCKADNRFLNQLKGGKTG